MKTDSRSRIDTLLHFGRKRRLPVVLQTEAAECGLACLAMVAGYHGYETDLPSLRQKFSISNQGISMRGLIELAGRMDLACRAFRVDAAAIAHVETPAILHWGANHFVVLNAVGNKRVSIHDPSCGERLISLPDFVDNFSGIAFELTPVETFRPRREKPSLTIGQFWSRAVGIKRSLGMVLLLAFLLQLFSIVSPLFSQVVIDDILLRNDASLLVALTIGFVLLLWFQLATALLREHLILNISTRLNIQMAANMFRHLIRLPLAYFSKRQLGDVVSRFGSLAQVREMITNGVVASIVDGSLVIITLGVMFVYDASLTLIPVVAVAIYVVMRLGMYRAQHLLTQEAVAAGAKADSILLESIRAIRVIKLFQGEADRQGLWQNRLAQALNKNISTRRLEIGFNTTRDFLYGTESLIVIYVGAKSIMADQMTVGMLIAYLTFKQRFMSSVGALVEQLISFRLLGVHLERLSDITHTPLDYVHESDGSLLQHNDRRDALQGRLEVRNLAYRYSDSSPTVFSNLSFTIEPGEVVAFVGPSGCGKTTLVLCLMGLLEPTEGEVLVDGRPLRQIVDYRRYISGILQDDQLLAGSIADNIAGFSSNLDMEEVQRCARLACIHDEIMRMPMRYQTLVGDMGSSFSGGQQQRMVLARALYRAPKILFMDEATSHLDIANELNVNQNIRALGMTRVIVAHRPETIKCADRQISLATTDEHTGALVSTKTGSARA